MDYLPSKRVAVALFFSLLLLIAAFIFTDGKNYQNSQSDTNIKVSGFIDDEENIQKESQEDSDKDGLLDWEETLWGTDSKNPDTDQDGTTDGDEISLHRNPLVPGPDDPLAEDIKRSDYVNSLIEDAGKSKTYKVSVGVITDILEAKKSGDISEFEKESIEENFFETFAKPPSLDKDFPLFAPEDLKTVLTTKSSIKKYGNDLGKVILDYADVNSYEEPLNIFIDAIENNDKERADDLKVLSQEFRSGAVDMTKIAVPRNISTAHLLAINNLMLKARYTNLLGDGLTDPIGSMQALSPYYISSNNLADSLKIIGGYIEQHDIYYAPGETGYMSINNL